MKKVFFAFGLLLTVSVATIVFNSCKDKKDEPKEVVDPTDPTVEVSSISLDSTALILIIGEDYTLTATVLPDSATNKTITWESSNPAKATVVDGKVTAIAAGTTTITAKAGDKTAACSVKIIIYPSTVDGGVVINGIKWATRNVAAPGHFADSPEEAGMFYQWGSTTAWNTTDLKVKGWDSNYLIGNIWDTNNNVCPAGWRVPTNDEFRSLIDAGSTWTTEGRVFGTAPDTLFLPAVGNRDYSNGTLDGRGNSGGYWSNTMYSAGGVYYMYFDSTEYINPAISIRSSGLSVRCVAE